jgi:hypothetical protein
MSLGPEGFAIIDLPPATAEVMDSFFDLPDDPRCPGRQRRFSQYRITFRGSWGLDLLPPRPLIQSARYNAYVGGIERHLSPLVTPLGHYVDLAATTVPLDVDRQWQVDLHQWRTVCEPASTRASVPEGPHRDGYDYVAIFVLRRVRISGGVTELYHDGRTIFSGVLDEGQGVVFDDRALTHFATEIAVVSGTEAGYRDIIAITLNSWEARRYGESFETRSRANG